MSNRWAMVGSIVVRQGKEPVSSLSRRRRGLSSRDGTPPDAVRTTRPLGWHSICTPGGWSRIAWAYFGLLPFFLFVAFLVTLPEHGLLLLREAERRGGARPAAAGGGRE